MGSNNKILVFRDILSNIIAEITPQRFIEKIYKVEISNLNFYTDNFYTNIPNKDTIDKWITENSPTTPRHNNLKIIIDALYEAIIDSGKTEAISQSINQYIFSSEYFDKEFKDNLNKIDYANNFRKYLTEVLEEAYRIQSAKKTSLIKKSKIKTAVNNKNEVFNTLKHYCKKLISRDETFVNQFIRDNIDDKDAIHRLFNICKDLDLSKSNQSTLNQFSQSDSFVKWLIGLYYLTKILYYYYDKNYGIDDILSEIASDLKTFNISLKDYFDRELLDDIINWICNIFIYEAKHIGNDRILRLKVNKLNYQILKKFIKSYNYFEAYLKLLCDFEEYLSEDEKIQILRTSLKNFDIPMFYIKALTEYSEYFSEEEKRKLLFDSLKKFDRPEFYELALTEYSKYFSEEEKRKLLFDGPKKFDRPEFYELALNGYSKYFSEEEKRKMLFDGLKNLDCPEFYELALNEYSKYFSEEEKRKMLFDGLKNFDRPEFYELALNEYSEYFSEEEKRKLLFDSLKNFGHPEFYKLALNEYSEYFSEEEKRKLLFDGLKNFDLLEFYELALNEYPEYFSEEEKRKLLFDSVDIFGFPALHFDFDNYTLYIPELKKICNMQNLTDDDYLKIMEEFHNCYCMNDCTEDELIDKIFSEYNSFGFTLNQIRDLYKFFKKFEMFGW